MDAAAAASGRSRERSEYPVKYIRFKHRGFVIFEETQSHSEFAKMVGDEVESAGFVYATECFDSGRVVCSGESQTLRASAAVGDTDWLRLRLSN